MTRQEFIEKGLTYAASYEDYPFDEVTAVLRHRGNRKIFALVMHRAGKDFVNLKLDPGEALIVRELFRDVTPGYHMNKTHWSSVVLGPSSDVPDEVLENLLAQSYALTRPKRNGRQRPENPL